MPELPEVETTVNYLKKKITGLNIRDFWSDKEKPVSQAGGIRAFRTKIKGKKILSVRRRAKYIVLDIAGKSSIFIHQKISGHLLYGQWRLQDGVWVGKSGALKSDPKNRFIRLIFLLSNGYQLALSDLRRFGRVLLVDDDKIDQIKEVKSLGPEPLDISFPEFKNLFTKKRGVLKPVLMDPAFIVGIGNIYADEILWKVGLHPLSRVENLKLGDIKKLYDHMVLILKEAIKHKGSSMDDYRVPSGEKGSAQLFHNAYQKTGKKCAKNDGGTIKRIVIGQRSAHFCDKHQLSR